MEEGENLDQPLSPSLLVEEDQEVVEESEEEEEIAGTPPQRIEDMVVPTSPIISSQRRVLSRRRGFGSQEHQTRASEDGGSQSSGQGRTANLNQDHPLVDEPGLVDVVPGAVHHVPAVSGVEETNGLSYGENRIGAAEEVAVIGPTSFSERSTGNVPGEVEAQASTSSEKNEESRPRKKRKRVSEDEVWA